MALLPIRSSYVYIRLSNHHGCIVLCGFAQQPSTFIVELGHVSTVPISQSLQL